MTEAAMAKKQKGRRKPYTPPTTWDTGPDTALQRQNKVIEPATWTDPETGEKRNPNGITRARRTDLVEVYHRRGYITLEQFEAAKMLLQRMEDTYRSGIGFAKPKVDQSSSPDRISDIMLKRVYRLISAKAALSEETRRTVERVVIDSTPIERDTKRMADQIDRMARLSVGLQQLHEAYS